MLGDIKNFLAGDSGIVFALVLVIVFVLADIGLSIVVGLLARKMRKLKALYKMKLRKMRKEYEHKLLLAQSRGGYSQPSQTQYQPQYQQPEPQYQQPPAPEPKPQPEPFVTEVVPDVPQEVEVAPIKEEKPQEKPQEKVVKEPVKEEPILDNVIEDDDDEDDDEVEEALEPGKVKKDFSAFKITFDEAYEKLSREQRSFFDQLLRYALSKPDSSEHKNIKGIMVKYKSKPLLRLRIKAGVTTASCIVENSLLKSYRRATEKEQGTKIAIKPTNIAIKDITLFEAAKGLVDVAQEQIDQEIEARKERRKEAQRERRRKNRAKGREKDDDLNIDELDE